MTNQSDYFFLKVLYRLKKYAREEMYTDQPDRLISEYAGSNVDDAYELGKKDGKIEMAREILEYLDTP